MSPTGVASAQYQGPLEFRDQIFKKVPKPRRLSRSFKTSSLDRGQKSYYMNWRVDRARPTHHRIPTPESILDHSSTTYCGTPSPDWRIERKKVLDHGIPTPPDTDPKEVDDLWQTVRDDLSSRYGTEAP